MPGEMVFVRNFSADRMKWSPGQALCTLIDSISLENEPMNYLHLTKACPQCSEVIAGWHKRLFRKDRASEWEPFADSPVDKTTWGPFACAVCGARLVLICADHKLIYKIAGAVFAGLVAGFILPAFIGLARCFFRGLFFAVLLIALFVFMIIARAVTVDVVKSASAFITGKAS